MTAFSIISAYKPSILYVKNRPKDIGDMGQRNIRCGTRWMEGQTTFFP